ncbi:MAG TPA: hypothetical protein VEA15_07895, partial [Caulobacteraceae bacterium]|nr:hypothetical protein [Caulobacteraceae bacterium]
MGSEKRATRSIATGAVAAAAVLLPSLAAAAPAANVYYERALMSAAGARCGLFTPAVATALSAATAQARGAALRSGVAITDLKQVRARASAKAAGTPCDSADLRTAAGRVRSAFEAWSRLAKMTFPGERAPWLADRTSYRSARWKLVQTPPRQPVATAFGYAGDLDRQALLAVADFGADQPYAARLVLRDETRTPLPWLGSATTRALPPRAASRFIMAEARDVAEPGLVPAPGKSGTAFRFPARAADALAELDPRERFAVEFLFRGDRVKTVVFEVGDFAAGKAFLAFVPVYARQASARRSAG